MVSFVANVPTSVGATESTSLPFIDQIDWHSQRQFSKELEELGYDGLAIPDHLMTGKGATECMTTLAGLACATDNVYLYPKTANNVLRHGPMLAKYAATIDEISNGRLKLGMGGGWHESEAIAFGYEWPDAPNRLRAMEETIEITKRLWTEETVTFEGEYYSVQDAYCRPKPVQDPHPPIMVGGGGEQFTLKIASKYADTWNYIGPHDYMERKLSILLRHCKKYGRDFDEIETSWFGRCVIGENEAAVENLLDKVPRFKPRNWSKSGGGAPEYHLVGTPDHIIQDIERYLELGISEIVVEFIDFPRAESARVFAEEVMPHFR